MNAVCIECKRDMGDFVAPYTVCDDCYNSMSRVERVRKFGLLYVEARERGGA
jgi:hypothetical protein